MGCRFDIRGDAEGVNGIDGWEVVDTFVFDELGKPSFVCWVLHEDDAVKISRKLNAIDKFMEEVE